MKTKEKDEKEKNRIEEYAGMPILIIVLLSIMLIFTIITFFSAMRSLQHQLTQANLTIAQEHSQILNLTRSLAQANATAQALRSNLSQAQATINMQKAQITNLTKTLNLTESQIVFNRFISLGPSSIESTCDAYGCYSYPSVTTTVLHFNFTRAGYIVINTTSPNTLYLFLVQNYSKTWFSTNSSGVIGILNASVMSLTMPVLPGWATLKLGYSNATVPYQAQLTITYHS